MCISLFLLIKIDSIHNLAVNLDKKSLLHLLLTHVFAPLFDQRAYYPKPGDIRGITLRKWRGCGERGERHREKSCGAIPGFCACYSSSSYSWILMSPMRLKTMESKYYVPAKKLERSRRPKGQKRETRNIKRHQILLPNQPLVQLLV